jgi:hypothetical protein
MRKIILECVVLGSAVCIACSGGGSGGGGSGGVGGGNGDAGTTVDAGTGGGTDAGTGGGTDAGTGGATDAGTGGGTDGGTVGGGGGDLGAFCSGLGSALSNVFTQCLKATPAFISTFKTAFSPASCASLATAASSGRIHFDPAKAAACTSAIQAAGSNCPGYETAVDTVCQSAVTGTVANGGACFSSADCAAGTCDLGATCPGACLAFATQGQACDPVKAVCSPGLTCDTTTSTCKAISGVGGPCPCLAGEYCDTGTTTCLAKVATGPCASGDECAFGSVCVQGQCARYVAVGTACNGTAETSACGIGSYCDPGTSTCLAWPLVGQSCASFPVCQTGYCDPATSICTAPKATGAACTSPLQCQSGDYCDLVGDKTCKTEKANGAACAQSFECQSGTCTSGVCAAGTTCEER